MSTIVKNYEDGRSLFQAHRSALARDHGIVLDGVNAYAPEGWSKDYGLAMDAIPGLSTTSTAGIPAFLSTVVDPKVVEVLFAPVKAGEVLGEELHGNWASSTLMFNLVEEDGEVSAYGDRNNNGRADINTSNPQRQNARFQTIVEYGDLEVETAGLAQLDLISRKDKAAANVLRRHMNMSYLFGVNGLQNYGLLNDPGLLPAVGASIKTAGGTVWVTPAGVVNATANEVFADIQTLVARLVAQSGNNIDADSPMRLVMSGTSAMALTATNQFGVNVRDLLAKNFPNMTVVTVPQYGALSASNPNGSAAGNLVQLIATEVGGQQTGFCAFSAKLRTHNPVIETSSVKKKFSAATFGTVLLQPFAVATMNNA